MTKDPDSFDENLKISRNKVEMLLKNHIDSVIDAIMNGNDPILPIDSKKRILAHSKKPIKFEIMLEIMIEIYLNLQNGQIKTKRDIYYSNTALFKTQTTLDSAVADISRTLSVSRDALNVVGASKGLFYGELLINNTFHPSTNPNLIPRREDIKTIDLLSTGFLLIIEKDAVMNVIINEYEHLKNILGSFLLISGKGFPCMRTKQFLNLIESKYPNIPKYIMVDNDPYGIDIALNYAISNKNELNGCESIQYIGINHYDIDKYADPQKFEQLTLRDLKRLETIKIKAKSLNRTPELDEITFMQNNLKKAEIESLYYPDSISFCRRFLLDKIQGLLHTKFQNGRGSTAEFTMDREQLNLHFDKSLAAIQSFQRDYSQITLLSQQIEQGILRENEDISVAKTDLLAAKIILQNRLEYDQIAKDILTFQSRPELLNNIQSVERDISSLLQEIESIDSRTLQRYSESTQILESIQLLLENVNYDCKEFK